MRFSPGCACCGENTCTNEGGCSRRPESLCVLIELCDGYTDDFGMDGLEFTITYGIVFYPGTDGWEGLCIETSNGWFINFILANQCGYLGSDLCEDTWVVGSNFFFPCPTDPGAGGFGCCYDRVGVGSGDIKLNLSPFTTKGTWSCEPFTFIADACLICGGSTPNPTGNMYKIYISEGAC